MHVFPEQEKVETNESQTRTSRRRNRNINLFWTCIMLSGGLELGSGYNTAIEKAISVIHADCNTDTSGGGVGVTTQQNVKSCLF